MAAAVCDVCKPPVRVCVTSMRVLTYVHVVWECFGAVCQQMHVASTGRRRRPTGVSRARRSRGAITAWAHHSARISTQVFVFCWCLLTSPFMVCHVSGLQPVSTLHRECASTLAAFSPTCADSNAVVLLPLCRGTTQHRWPPDVCAWFTSGCVSLCVCKCSYVLVSATELSDAHMVLWCQSRPMHCVAFHEMNSWLLRMWTALC